MLPIGILAVGMLPIGILPIGMLPIGSLPIVILAVSMLSNGSLPIDILAAGVLPIGISPIIAIDNPSCRPLLYSNTSQCFVRVNNARLVLQPTARSDHDIVSGNVTDSLTVHVGFTSIFCQYMSQVHVTSTCSKDQHSCNLCCLRYGHLSILTLVRSFLFALLSCSARPHCCREIAFIRFCSSPSQYQRQSPNCGYKV